MSNKQRRMTPDARREQILDTARIAARHTGLYVLTVSEVADRVGVSNGTVFHYFSSISELRNHVIYEAIKNMDVRILVQVLAVEPHAIQHLSVDIRKRILDELQQLLNV